MSKMIYHQYINDKMTVKIFVESNENEDEEKNEVFNIQIRHEFKIEERVYERFITKFSFSTEIKQMTLRCVSKK